VRVALEATIASGGVTCQFYSLHNCAETPTAVSGSGVLEKFVGAPGSVDDADEAAAKEVIDRF
jgi:hypothetical protein